MPKKHQQDLNTVPQRLFDIHAAAKYLGRPVWSVRELIWKGRLPYIQEGQRGKVYFDVQDLEKYVQETKRFR